MEKRLVLFFVLVALTMLVFQYLVAPPRPAPATLPEAPVDSIAASPEHPVTAHTPAAPIEGIMAGILPASPETATVRTDHLVLTLGSVGARLISCELPKYREEGDRPVRRR